MIILGIDPGYDRLGYCIARMQNSECRMQDFNCIQTNKNDSLIERYKQISEELHSIINKYHPDTLAIETVLFSKNKKTAMRVAEVKGVIIQIAISHGLDIAEYNPGEIKLAVTGNGRADKKAVEKMLQLELKFDASKKLDDALDAVGVAYTHFLMNK